jgi:hypothetical protein
MPPFDVRNLPSNTPGLETQDFTEEEEYVRVNPPQPREQRGYREIVALVSSVPSIPHHN